MLRSRLLFASALSASWLFFSMPAFPDLSYSEIIIPSTGCDNVIKKIFPILAKALKNPDKRPTFKIYGKTVQAIRGSGDEVQQPLVVVHWDGQEYDFDVSQECQQQILKQFSSSASVRPGLGGSGGAAAGPAKSASLSAGLPHGEAASQFVSGDFNGDGIPDVVAAYGINSSPLVAVALGNSDGATFQTATNYQSNGVPVAVVAADFNNDGALDLAVANNSQDSAPQDNTVTILLGNKDGTFQAPKSYNAGTGLSSLAAADLNGDGKIDLVVTWNGSFGSIPGGVSFLAGNGDGSFAGPVTIATGGAPNTVLISDFTGDGKLDVAYGETVLATRSNTSNRVVILPGAGNGTFGAPIYSTVGGSVDYLGFADFNHDGISDLASQDYNDNSISILLGAGGGSFHAAVPYVSGYQPYGFAFTDIDGDGNIDIAIGDPTDQTINDFTTDPTITNVIFLLGQPDGTFQGATVVPNGHNNGLVIAADFNGDGKPDVLAADAARGRISLQYGNGAGGFQNPISIQTSIQLSALVSGDFNGDGKADFVVAVFDNTGRSSGQLQVYQNQGGSGFQSLTAFNSGGPGPAALAVADVNGDGKPDLAVVNNPALQGASSSTPPNVVILNGGGNGAFTLSTTLTDATSPVAVALGDVDGDGLPDLIVADTGGSQKSGAVLVYLNQGGGTFGTPTAYSASSSPGLVYVADLNGDGLPDILAATADASGNCYVAGLLNTGSGSFSSAVLTKAECGNNIAVAPFTGRKVPDLAVSHCCGETDMTFFYANGDGTFLPEFHFPAGASPLGLAVADLNGDGQPDLVVGNNAGGYFVPLLNAFPAPAAIVNAATFAANQTVAPASIATVFAPDLANTQEQTSSFGPTLGGTLATMIDSAAVAANPGLFFVSPHQVNLQIPPGAATGIATMNILSGDGTVSSVVFEIAPVVPGIFALNAGGLAAAEVLRVTNGVQDLEQVYQLGPSKTIIPRPIDLSTGQVYLELFGTGIRNAQNVTVTVGGQSLKVLFAGPQGTFAGEDQINAGPLPISLAGSGSVNITLTADGLAANTTNVTIQ